MLQLEKYQEQAQLLDPHMEGLIRPMAAILREQARSKQSADMNITLNVCKILWTAASVRCELHLGHSTAVRSQADGGGSAAQLMPSPVV